MILYFGDFDPSGQDIPRSLMDNLNFFETWPQVEMIALTLQDIITHDLPSNFTKSSDNRSAKFIEQNGDCAVELDALPVQVLQQRIRESIEAYMDLEALARVRVIEDDIRNKLREEVGKGSIM